MTEPGPLTVQNDKEGNQKGELHVATNGPSPEETPVVGCLKVGVNVADEQKLGPPLRRTVIVHETSRKPDRSSAHVRENSPPHKEAYVVDWGKSKVFPRIELQHILHTDVALGLIEAKQLIGAQKGRKVGEHVHDHVRTDHNGENQLLKEALDHPRIDSLCAHEKLGCDAQLTEEVAKKFDSFDDVQFAIVPQFTL